jgi:hypothetical protein
MTVTRFPVSNLVTENEGRGVLYHRIHSRVPAFWREPEETDQEGRGDSPPVAGSEVSRRLGSLPVATTPPARPEFIDPDDPPTYGDCAVDMCAASTLL